MFKNGLSNTPMNTDAANQFFHGKIDGEGWQRDYTFLATLRALLANRMGENDRIYLSFGVSTYSEEQLSNLTVSRALNVAVGDYIENDNSIRIHNFNSTSELSNSAWMEVVRANFEKSFAGWHRIERVTGFFRKVFNVQCFINPEKKSVYLFTCQMEMRRMHYLQCGILAFLPWYFDPQEGVSDDEMSLLNSLREKTSDKYLECLNVIAAKFDFQTARIRTLLKGFETRYERLRCDNMKRELENINWRLNELQEQIGNYLKSRRDTETSILGLEMKIAQGGEDSEIMDYFLCNKQLLLQSVDGSTMEFIVRSTLDYFDEGMAEKVINNQHSYCYEVYGSARRGNISHDDMKMLLTEIFLNQRLKMRLCAAYHFQLEGGVTALRGYSYGGDCCEYMPNPHIDGWACIGTYGKVINERLRDRDYIGAIEQCIASCKSLNFGDSTVMDRFMNMMYGHADGRNMRCIELPDGRVVTPKDAVGYLKKEKEVASNG